MKDARENFVQKILKEIAAEQGYGSPVILTSAIPATGANFTSQLFNATIQSKDKKELKLFAKVSVLGVTMREQSGDAYQFETFFYTELLKKFQAFENKHNVPEDQRLLVPKYYGHSQHYLEEVIVFEDLSEQGFLNYDRLKSVDWTHSSKVIEQLAKFHALSIALQKESPLDYQNALKTIDKCKMLKENGPLDMLFQEFKSQTIQMIKEENRPRVQQFLEMCTGERRLSEVVKSKERPVIVHSDYRPSNLMYKVTNDGKLQVVILDLQTMSEGSVFVDLLHFIFTGSDGEFRERYFDQLIEHYYQNLAVALRRLNLDPEEMFPRADFNEELKQVLPYGLMVASIMLPGITADLDNADNTGDGVFVADSMDAISNLVANYNDRCARRLNEVIDDYIRWGIL